MNTPANEAAGAIASAVAAIALRTARIEKIFLMILILDFVCLEFFDAIRDAQRLTIVAAAT
jgi:hypothetical protein